MMQWATKARAVFVTSAILVVAFFVHRYTQFLYYSRCQADIIQVVFFRSSAFCTLLRSTNTVIEQFFEELAHKALSPVWAITAAAAK